MGRSLTSACHKTVVSLHAYKCIIYIGLLLISVCAPISNICEAQNTQQFLINLAEYSQEKQAGIIQDKIELEGHDLASDTLSILYRKLGLNLYKMDSLEQAIHFTFLAVQSANVDKHKSVRHRALKNLAFFEKKNKNYYQASEYYEEVLHTLPAHTSPASAYQAIGVIKFLLEEYEQAFNNYQAALSSLDPSNHEKIIQTYQLMAESLLMTKKKMESEKALIYGKKALDLIDKTKSETYLGITLNATGDALYYLKDYEGAHQCYVKSRNKKNVGLHSYYNNIALNALKNDKFDLSLLYFDSLRVELEQHPDTYNSHNWALYYDNLGEWYFYQNKYDAAVLYFDTAAMYSVMRDVHLRPITKCEQIVQAPNPRKTFNYLSDKYRASSKLLDSNNNEDYVKNMTSLTMLIDSVQDYVRTQFLHTGSLIEFMEQAQHNYKIMAELAFVRQDANLMFQIMEKSRSLLLEQHLNTSAAHEFLPDSLKDIVSKLQLKIQTSKSDKNYEDYATHAIHWENLMRSIESKYSDYYSVKYDQKMSSLQHIQHKLERQDVYISFLISNDHIYGLVVRPHEVQMIDILNKGQIDETVVTCLQAIHKKNSGENLTRDLHRLYNAFLNPLKLRPGERLILSLDGTLNYLPFEAFMRIDDKNQFEASNFVLAQHDICYQYSATLWTKMEQAHTDHNKTLLVVAPDFTQQTVIADNRDSAGALLHNQKESQVLRDLMGGEQLNENVAADLTNYQDYSMIHFATHSLVNTHNNDSSFIVVKGGRDPAHLFLKDIKSGSLAADMVFLSSCNSGDGNIVAGDGVMSLARSFAFAGTKSMVASLWEASDLSAFLISKEYYQKLKKGDSKSRALAESKQAYLRSHSREFRHPFYWANLIVIGDDASLHAEDNWIYVSLISVLLFLVLFHFYGKVRKVSQQNT